MRGAVANELQEALALMRSTRASARLQGARNAMQAIIHEEPSLGAVLLVRVGACPRTPKAIARVLAAKDGESLSGKSVPGHCQCPGYSREKGQRRAAWSGVEPLHSIRTASAHVPQKTADFGNKQSA